MSTDWPSLIRACNFVTCPGATSAALASNSLPQPLQELLAFSDGLRDAYGVRLVLPAEAIARTNAQMRTLCTDLGLMSVDHLLFFGERGNGDLAFFPLIPKRINATEVFVWDHESDERRWFANSLQDYLQRLSRG